MTHRTKWFQKGKNTEKWTVSRPVGTKLLGRLADTFELSLTEQYAITKRCLGPEVLRVSPWHVWFEVGRALAARHHYGFQTGGTGGGDIYEALKPKADLILKAMVKVILDQDAPRFPKVPLAPKGPRGPQGEEPLNTPGKE